MNIDDMPDRALTVREVAVVFRVTSRTIYRWIDEGVLEAHKLRGVVRVERRTVLKFWKRSKQ